MQDLYRDRINKNLVFGKSFVCLLKFKIHIMFSLKQSKAFVHMRLTHLLTAIIITCGSALHAQESVNSAGGNAAGSGGSASYSIGQLVYTTNTGATGSVAQGVQHAYEIFPVGISHLQNVSIAAWPNPTADMLVLNIGNYKQASYTYVMYDAQGKAVLNGSINAAQTNINTQQLAMAAYFLNIYDQRNQQIQSFKIIKN